MVAAFIERPIAIPEDRQCDVNLDESRTAGEFEQELIKINNFLEVTKEGSGVDVLNRVQPFFCF